MVGLGALWLRRDELSHQLWLRSPAPQHRDFDLYTRTLGGYCEVDSLSSF